METLYYILFGAVCFTTGFNIGKPFAKNQIKAKFHNYFKKFKSIGKPKFDNLI